MYGCQQELIKPDRELRAILEFVLLRKVATMLGLCLDGVGRGALAAPLRIKLS